MFARLILTLMASLLLLSSEAFGQICSISHYPYGFVGKNRPKMHGDKFKNITEDLPFIPEGEGKQRYSQFWVKENVLNVRSGPSFNHDIISETYYGNLVFALAKQGDWVAIRRSITIDDIDVLPRWVHIKYLSSNRIDEQVDTQILKAKCNFLAQGTYINNIKDLSLRLANTYSPCGSVRSYLNRQQLLGESHNYVQEYDVWRKSQKDPVKYSVFNCQNP